MNSDHPWYILLVRGGKEKKIIDQIKKEAVKNNVSKKIVDLYFIPHSTKPKNLLSGCVFYCGQLDENLVQLFYSVSGVIRFLDHSREEKELPSPLSPRQIAEFSDLLEKIKKGEVSHNQAENQENVFQTNAEIEVFKGPFAGCKGKIVDIDEEEELITVNVNFLGRLTPTKVLMNDCIKEVK